MGMVERDVSQRYERQVVEGLSLGLGSRLIARKYGMYVRTVQRIRKRLEREAEKRVDHD